MTTLSAYLLQHPKRYLIFDFDETLFTLQIPWAEYYQDVRKRLGQFNLILPTYDQLDDLSEVENAATKKYGKQAANIIWECSEAFETKYFQNKVIEHRDLTDFIRKEGKNYTVYLWTSNMRTTVEYFLKREKLLPFFSQLVTKGDVMQVKPEPEGFFQIFDPKQQQKSEFLMIGNSQSDQKAAAAAGIDFWLRP